jgi:hypothetical protein
MATHIYQRNLKFEFKVKNNIKIIADHNELSTTHGRRMLEWKCSSSILNLRPELKGQLHALASLPPGTVLGTHCIGGWMGPRAGLDVVEKRNLNLKTERGEQGEYVNFCSFVKFCTGCLEVHPQETSSNTLCKMNKSKRVYF